MRTNKARNFGFGKQMNYAVNQVIDDRYGGGQYGTVAAHRDRFVFFQRFLKDRFCVADLRYVSHEMVLEYAYVVARQVEDELIAVKTAKNRISTVNVVLSHMRGDSLCYVAPASVLGNVSSIRRVAPSGLELSKVELASQRLEALGHDSSAMAVRLVRMLGLRIREAGLMNLKRAVREAGRDKVINVIDGTKGGRKVARHVPVSDKAIRLVWKALELSYPYGKLVGDKPTFIQWYNATYYHYGKVAHEGGLSTKFHDLRSAYACERYQQETGYQAPVLTGGRKAPKTLDLDVRTLLAFELGHARPQVLGSYIGGIRSESTEC